jgi:hypothetical protein
MVCFGEVLARFSTPVCPPLADAPALSLHFAGAEANVSVQFAVLWGEAGLVARVPEVNAEALAAFRKLGLALSCDLHYQSALWTTGEAARAMRPMVRELHQCICGASESRSVLGAPGGDGGDAGSDRVAGWLREHYGIRSLATLIRTGETAQGGTLRGVLSRAEHLCRRFALCTGDGKVRTGKRGVCHSAGGGVEAHDSRGLVSEQSRRG